MLREDATGQLNLALWKHDSLSSSFQLYRLASLSHMGKCVMPLQYWSSWPGKRQHPTHRLMEDNLPLV